MVKVVLVGVEGSINLGFILRLAMNFDVDRLVLVSPREIDWGEVKRFSAKAHALADSIEIVGELSEAFEGDEARVCTSAIISDSDLLRQSITIEEYKRIVRERGGRVALVFGRESTGLTRQELSLCDCVVTIPTSNKYPSLNLSHAVAIMLYETFNALGRAYAESSRAPLLASREEVSAIESELARLAACVSRDEGKRARMVRAFMNVVKRGTPRKIEARVMLYFLRRLARKANC